MFSDDELKKEFEKHVASRECEHPSKAMLFELFREGYKLGLQPKTGEKPAKKHIKVESKEFD